jgi:hypothetical protein
MAIRYKYNGRDVDQAALQTHPVVATGPDLAGDRDTVYLFDNEQDLLAWGRDQPVIAEKAAKLIRSIEVEAPDAYRNSAELERVQKLAISRTRTNMEEFAQLHRLNLNDEETILRAMNRSSFQPRVFDPVIFYDRLIEREPPTSAPEDPGTAMLFLPGGLRPDLGLFGWSDRARSARIFGAVCIIDPTWFGTKGGKRAWLFGFNFLLNLNHVGMDRVTSSVALL